MAGWIVVAAWIVVPLVALLAIDAILERGAE